MSWFDQYEQGGFTGGTTGTDVSQTGSFLDPNVGNAGQMPTGQMQAGPTDIMAISQLADQYARSLGGPTAENLQKTADWLKTQGYDASYTPGADGVNVNGYGMDMVANWKSGNGTWQTPIIDTLNGQPLQSGTSNYQTGTYTGGGQYPLASVMGTGLMQPWTTAFNAPTAEQARQTPGYQFSFDEGMKALNRGAAGKGTLLTGGTLKDATSWAQGNADTNYNNVYNRALNEYQQAYNIYNQNANNQYNRLSGISSTGQNAAAGTGNAASNYANQGSNLLTGAGNATAAGQVGSANAIGGAVSNVGNTAANLALYNSIYGQRSNTGAGTQTPTNVSGNTAWMANNLYGG
jgi:hypothetical protein